MENRASIAIKKKTRKKLKKLGSKGETYDDIINRLIEIWKESGNNE